MLADVLISWTPLGGDIGGYRIYDVTGAAPVLMQDVGPTAVQYLAVDYLTAYGDYQFATAAYNGAGEGPMSPPGQGSFTMELPGQMPAPGVVVVPKL